MLTHSSMSFITRIAHTHTHLCAYSFYHGFCNKDPLQTMLPVLPDLAACQRQDVVLLLGARSAVSLHKLFLCVC